MKELASLVGQAWLDGVPADTRRRAHPLRFPLVQTEAVWSRWRETFDAAVGLVVTLLANDQPARDRLVAKIKDRRQFWSTVPEIVWAARLRRLGMQVVVEPIIGRSGPDMRFTTNGFTAHAEVYAPVFQADEFSWADDLQEDLEPLDVGYHVSVQDLPPRRSENRSAIRKALRRIIGGLKSRNDTTPYYRVYLRGDLTERMVPMPGYCTLDFDPIMDQETDLLCVTDLHFTPGLGGITVSTDVTNGHRDMGKLLRDLGQLQPGANLLIVDTSREFIHKTTVELACDGAFARHPELSAIAVSSWGVYPAPTTNPLADHHFVEEYDFIVNPNAKTPFPAEVLAAMGQPGLLGITI